MSHFSSCCRNALTTGVVLVVAIAGSGVAALSTLARAADGPDMLRASSTSPVHPILIRNEHGPLARVVVENRGAADVSLKSLTFAIEGAAELAFLSLFSTGDQLEFPPTALSGERTGERVGEPVAAAGTVVLKVERPLPPGRHVFWLSGRLNDTADLSHSVGAVCTQVETSTGTVAPARGTAVRHHVGVALRRHNDDGVHTYRIPALTTSAKGSLLCVYDMRRRMGRDLQEDIDIGLSRSTDGGTTWAAPRVIMDRGEYGGLPQEQNGCSDPGIIVDRQTGEIFVFAVWMNGKPGKHQWNDDGSEPGFEIGKAAQFLVVRSKDDGLTWSQPENLTRKLKQESWWLLAPSPQSGFQLADGTLVMPVQGRTGRDRLETFATLMISRDHGETWTVMSHAYAGGNECQAAPLGDGSILLNIRNDRERYRAVMITKDLGKSWRPHPTHRNTLIEPNCNGSLLSCELKPDDAKDRDTKDKNVPRRVLLFANPHTQKGRTHHTLQVSFDDGLTWPASHHRLLDEGRGAGYPSLTRIDDEHVGIVYEGSQAHLTFERFTLRELLHPRGSEAGDAGEPIRVENPQRLPASPLACERIPLGDPDDYKPCLARMPDGELLLSAFHQDKRDGGKVREQTLLFRSTDGGKHWSAPEPLELLGREPYLTILPDGTIFLTGHLLAQDVRNEWGYTTGFVHRSTDCGKTWETTRVESETIKPKASNHTTRNVLRLSDGTLLLGVDYDGGGGPYFLWRSKDNGKTWDKSQRTEPKEFQSKYGFFGGETWLWQAASGKIWALVRVDSNELPIAGRPIQAGNDQADHFILFASSDGGRTFDRIRDFGDYGEMYMSLLRLRDRRLLLTFTVRDLRPPLGVRALFGEETDDGFTFDFTRDRLTLDAKTPVGKPQGGGFGPTVQLDDGTLVTSYSWRGADDKTRLEVIRWNAPPTE